MREAEPRMQCDPRQEPGNERFYGGDQREVSFFERFTKDGFTKDGFTNAR